MKLQSVSILGATGSVGAHALQVIACHPQRFKVYALAAQRNVAQMLIDCQRFQPRYVVLTDAIAADQLRNQLHQLGSATEVLSGMQALNQVASAAEVDTVIAAIVGAAGLPSTYAAVQAGKKILLANKEAMVMAGHLLMPLAAKHGACLLPIDSEHNAIFQCLPTAHQQFLLQAPRLQQSVLQQNSSYESKRCAESNVADVDIHNFGIHKLVLTASGGPFRTWSAEQLVKVTPQQACQHPVWNMGAKISVDSATLMNKGLELIEACWLFAVTPAQVEIVVHPQGIVHSLVEYADGSILAQMATADMRIPIAHALAWPERMASGAETLSLLGKSLHFEAPRVDVFPCLSLAEQAWRAGGGAAIVLNAANEVAVSAFLAGKLGFTDIAGLLTDMLAAVAPQDCASLADILQLDSEVRHLTYEYLSRYAVSVGG